MSERLGNDDIEDVVSSVRRLVSPEARPRPMSRDLAMDRLILTPSLRIVAEQPASGPTIVKLETVARKSRPKARKAGGAGKSGSPAVAMPVGPKAGGGKGNQGPGISGRGLAEMVLGAEVVEVITDVEAVAAVSAVSPKKADRPSGKTEVSDHAGGDPAPALEKTGSARKRSVRPKAVAAKAVKAKSSAKPRAATAKAAVATPVKNRPATRRTVPKATVTPIKPAEKSAPALMEAAKPKVQAKRRIALKESPESSDATITALPFLLTPKRSESVVVTPEVDVAAAELTTPAALAPVAEAFPEVGVEVAETLTKEIMVEVAIAEIPVLDVIPSLTDANGNPISLLDEEALVAMVRQVIREELQGVLGEKITRNVRKLVHAEIAKALTAQTLE